MCSRYLFVGAQAVARILDGGLERRAALSAVGLQRVIVGAQHVKLGGHLCTSTTSVHSIIEGGT